MNEKTLAGEINNAYHMDEAIEHQIKDRETNKTEFQIDDNSTQLESTQPNHNQTSTEEGHRKGRYKFILKSLIHVVVLAYFAYATYHYIDIKQHQCTPDYALNNNLCGIQFCNGYGMLLLLIVFTYIGLFYYLLLKPKVGTHLYRKYLQPFSKWWKHFSRTSIVTIIISITLVIILIVFLYFETRTDRRKLKSLIAPCVFILTGYIFSTNRQAIRWRTVFTGIVCQFCLGIICIRWEVGRNIFQCIGNKVANFLAFTDHGTRFIFGDQIIDDGIFAFAILPVIFFFSFFISILYYLGTMQWIVMKLGWILQQLMGTTVCESVIAAANIFLGMSESPLLIRPYIKLLTASEIHAVMVSGFATVSGTVLAAYLSFGASPAHLITSSVMAAPAALAIAKLYMPETEESKTSSHNIELEHSEDSSLLDAASSGAGHAIPIVLGIVANIVAFVAFIAFLNSIVSWLGYLVGLENIDFEWLFSKLFIPLAWAMGVPNKDCDIIAKVVATKTILNEFVAYERLGEYTKSGAIDARSAGIATFAICGFANPSSLGILIGSLSAMAPNRRGLITSVAFRGFVVGSIVCFVSASFAGILMQEEQETRMYMKIFNSLERKNVTIALFKDGS